MQFGLISLSFLMLADASPIPVIQPLGSVEKLFTNSIARQSTAFRIEGKPVIKPVVKTADSIIEAVARERNIKDIRKQLHSLLGPKLK